MEQWIEQLMSDWGYIGVAFLIALENLFPPIPSEFILTFGGFMTTRTSMTIVGVIIASTIGSVFGAICLYMVGKLVRLSVLKRFLSGRMGLILRLKPSDVDKAMVWFQKHGLLTVFFCRFVPVIRSLISIPAGVARMNMTLFLVYTTLGSLIWNTVLICLGAWAGDNWESILATFDSVKYYIFIPVAIIVVYYGYKFVQSRKHMD
ncbi:DedA family protein [Caryophanon tenue]|uniref:Alkaline phosphatase n=1 Tax=Caryophanon tenue TaxID=33978 RepID=A0A1C0Y6W1_9BACL|nr:DedA family protein [Caryophanon tenue]OCS82929.1 alkaline phosphatase [Caryophanon tenue]